MILFITGATHTGKTKLAQKLMEKYKIPYFCQDHLKMGLIRSHYTDLTPDDDQELTDYLWPVIREMAKTAIENEQNMIIEGCYIPFDWQKDFDEEYLRNIRYICLCMSDRYIDNHFDHIRSFASCIENRLDDDYCTLQNIRNDNRMFLNGCIQNHLDYTLIDDDYESAISPLMHIL